MRRNRRNAALGVRSTVILAVALIVLLVPMAALAQKDWEIPTVERRILDALQEARAGAGSAPLESRTLLDEIARDRAEDVAARPKSRRLQEKTPIGDELEEAGYVLYHKAISRLILIKGVEPVRGVLERWQGHAQAWKTLTSPEINAVGMGTARTPDGWFVFVAVLVEDATPPGDRRELERKVFEEVNRIRSGNDLEPLVRRADLDAVAIAHSEDMADRAYMSHRSPEGETSAGRVATARIGYQRLAENLASNQRAKNPVRRAVKGWMASPGHRENILDPNYTHTGLGVAVAGDGTVYFTQIFLRP